MMSYSLQVAGRSRVVVGRAVEELPRLLPQGRVIVLTDRNVARCRPELFEGCDPICMEPGEEHKTLQTVEAVCPRADPPRRRPHDLPAGGGRWHRDRRHGLRGIGLHARRAVRVRLDDAAGVCRCERRRQERRQSGRVQEHGGRLRPAAVRRLRHVALRDASPAGDSRRTGRGGQGGDHRRRIALRADRAAGLDGLCADPEVMDKVVVHSVRSKPRS